MTTQLPEPQFIKRDADKITKEWIALYEEKTGKTLQPAQVERLLIDVGAYRENLLRIKIQEVAKSNLLSYAPMSVLEHLGELVGVKKLEGKFAKTTLRFEITEILTSDVLIPKGTEVETEDGNYTFVTDEDCIINAGSLFVEVSATCNKYGIGSNDYQIKKITNLLTPLNYVDIVYNTVVSYGGADEETENSLRERIRLAPESFSNAGSKGAYRFHTLSAHQSIKDVEVISSEAGVVDIYPLTDTGNPTPEIIKLVTEYLSADKIRPLTDKVVVHAPEKVNFTISAIITPYLNADLNTIQTIVNQRLNDYKTELASQLGKDIVPTQIIAILNSIYGVYKVELLSPAYQKLTKCQWANLESFNVKIGESADE